MIGFQEIGCHILFQLQQILMFGFEQQSKEMVLSNMK
jgi:hypothetical protein